MTTPTDVTEAMACTACGPEGITAADGSGPFDCYACGRKASTLVSHIKMALEIAYANGLHEFGYDPAAEVAALEAALAAPGPDEGVEAVIDAIDEYLRDELGAGLPHDRGRLRQILAARPQSPAQPEGDAAHWGGGGRLSRIVRWYATYAKGWNGKRKRMAGR